VCIVFNRIITSARFRGVRARRLIPHGRIQIGHGAERLSVVSTEHHTHTIGSEFAIQIH